MRGAGKYGILGGIVMVVLTMFAPQPVGSILFWSFTALHLMWGATVVWRRTVLVYWTTGMVLAAATSVMMAVLAMFGYVIPEVPDWALALLLVQAGVLLALHFAERRVKRAKWDLWAKYMDDKTEWDIVLCRHVLDLPNTVQTR